MDNNKLLNKIPKLPEIIVDFSKNPYGEMIINLNYNKKLSQKRKKLENHSNPYYKNILLLYLDSVSRANSIRQLKKTMKFIEQFMPYDSPFHKKFYSENYHSFQFFKYYSFIGYTSVNYPIIFYGNKKGYILFFT